MNFPLAHQPGPLRSVSASQITTFQFCPIRWWFGKVAGIQEPKTENLDLGDKVHGGMEGYYRTGALPQKPPDAPATYAPAFESACLILDGGAVPPRSEKLLIEHPQDYNLGITLAGVPVRGRADCLDLRDPKVAGIWDWKTTKFLKYAKTADDLPTNPQLNIYGEYVFQKFTPEYVRFFHGNIQTSSPGAYVSSTEPLERAFVQENYQRLAPTVEEMKTVAVERDPARIPGEATKNRCWAWNRRCHYADLCPAFQKNEMSALFGRNEAPSERTATKEIGMSLAERIRLRKQAQGVTESPGVETAPATPPAVERPAPVRASGINPPDAAPVETPKAVLMSEPALASSTNATCPPPVGSSSSTVVSGLVLFVDAHPRKGYAGVQYLEDEISRRQESAIAAVRKEEPNLVPDDAKDVREVKFAHGVNALLADFQRNPPTGVWEAWSGGLSGQVVEILAPLASVVVVGRG